MLQLSTYPTSPLEAVVSCHRAGPTVDRPRSRDRFPTCAYLICRIFSAVGGILTRESEAAGVDGR